MTAGETDVDVDATMAQLTREFLELCDKPLDELESMLVRVGNGGGWKRELSDFRRTVHSLKGRGGAFDSPSLSHIAHGLEDHVEALEVPALGDMTEHPAGGP